MAGTLWATCDQGNKLLRICSCVSVGVVAKLPMAARLLLLLPRGQWASLDC